MENDMGLQKAGRCRHYYVPVPSISLCNVAQAVSFKISYYNDDKTSSLPFRTCILAAVLWDIRPFTLNDS